MQPTRRRFLAGSLAAALGGVVIPGYHVLGADAKAAKAKDKEKDTEKPPTTKPSSSPSVEDATFVPTTLFLTWFRDPTTTMVVQWVGTAGETSDARVYYAGGKDKLWHAQPTIARPYPTTDFKVYRAELSGLVPGTEYQFRIGKSSPTWKFKTMPAKATDTVTFISGGDCGVNPHAVANNVQAARQDPAFALIGGDLGYDNGRSVEVSLAFLRNYSRTMAAREGRLIPMVTCIGNHEVDGGYDKPRAKAPFFYALFDGLYPETGHATLDFGDYLSLVLLDTGHTTRIDGAQTSWLEKVLRERQDHPNVFVANHVPAYPSYRKMATTPATQPGVSPKAGTGALQREHWCPLFDRYRVPVVLEHHDHTFKRTKPLIDGMARDDGVLYLGDGSWGRLRNPSAPDKLTFLAKSSRDYHLSLHRLEGEERFHIALDEFGRVMDVGRSGQRKRGAVAVPG